MGAWFVRNGLDNERSLGKSAIAVGLAWLLILALFIWLIVWADSRGAFDEPEPDSVPRDQQRVLIKDLQPGDCTARPWDERPRYTWQLVPCAESHHQEVFAAPEFPDGPFPEEDLYFGMADDACGDLFAQYTGHAVEDTPWEYGWLYFTEEQWNDGNRAVICVIDKTEPTTGSAKDADLSDSSPA